MFMQLTETLKLGSMVTVRSNMPAHTDHLAGALLGVYDNGPSRPGSQMVALCGVHTEGY